MSSWYQTKSYILCSYLIIQPTKLKWNLSNQTESKDKLLSYAYGFHNKLMIKIYSL